MLCRHDKTHAILLWKLGSNSFYRPLFLHQTLFYLCTFYHNFTRETQDFTKEFPSSPIYDENGIMKRENC
ncbi:hypothetical protein C9432_01050 [Enterococcus faecalis]|nr:hypothetical protein C9432_01050 [Enterococcus faecalis]